LSNHQVTTETINFVILNDNKDNKGKSLQMFGGKWYHMSQFFVQ